MMSLTPDQFRKSAFGVAPSPSPFLTPRPERRRTEPRVSDWNSNRQDKDKEVNVQVLLRCRPLSDDEQRSNIPRAIHCNEHKREVTVLQSVANKQVDRVFTFDKVFGPKAQQRSIYDQAVAPIVNEVLEGFNCTVFAYGQTGTGKTYTMEGGMRSKGGDLPAEAGVIPRAVRQIFDILEAQNADYSMKVTFLEIYNEEIADLLAPDDCLRYTEDRQKKPISLMEDGKGCVIVRGLEEEAVYSANEIYNLLERGAAKRRTADTLLNKRSSRSHSVFSITVHVKETSIGDEELIKCGKLNLVDLAGSENISRSGSREGRAREAGEINKSLLTLGRVINALVEHSAHIPYRDSKLTRMLRDSLGGKTKTCIIATISPSANCLEETLSTLDYAYRAKNIRNKPEANQKMSKTVLLKDLYLEIERMREDVRAAREKNGIYITNERFAKDEAEKKARIEKIEQYEIDLNLSEKQVDKFRELYLTEQEKRLDVDSELKDCKINLERSNKAYLDLQENHNLAISTLKEKELIISKLLHSESSIIERAKELRTDLQIASEDITTLFVNLDQKSKVEADNRSLVLTFGSQLDQSLKNMHKTILGSVSQQQQQLRCMEEHVHSFLASKCDATQALESRIQKMTERYSSGMVALKELGNTLRKKTSSDLDQITSTISSQTVAVEKFLKSAILEAKEVIWDIQTSINEQKRLLLFSAQQQEKGLQRNLVSAQVTSKAAIDFFIDLHHRASKVVKTLEELHIEKSHQLENFENSFKEEAAKDEKLALEKISVILQNLTSKKASMVSKASKNLHNTNIEEKSRLQKEMSSMQHISDNAKNELNEYINKAEIHFFEDTFSAAETCTIMENCIQESSRKVEYTEQQWENAKLSINNLTKLNMEDIEATVKASISANDQKHNKLSSAASFLVAEFYENACGVQSAVKESLKLDHESKRTLDSMSSICLDQLKSIQGNHSENISSIRSQADKCLAKDYLVDQYTNSTPKNRFIVVPTVASIEEMRTHVYKNDSENNSDNVSKSGLMERKIHQQCVAVSPNRTPFLDVN